MRFVLACIEKNQITNRFIVVEVSRVRIEYKHIHLLCLYHNPDMRLRDVARLVGITERMVQKIVADLATAGYLEITKEGRCNHYRVNADMKLRHPLEMHHTVGELLEILNLISEQPGPKPKAGRSAKPSNGQSNG